MVHGRFISERSSVVCFDVSLIVAYASAGNELFYSRMEEIIVMKSLELTG